ncbi:o-succinylbenzoate--CoA ligase [Enterococcus saccharolyticus]|uniref:o-succinylbenzoate--CoA ligase n=1 Tax=Enterococcus saccharolyticus TaxID=41997 RepID=UPI001E325FF0|nr:o-succinylbenzoate--CoA ligase [Enterococcus saccharolyticus]MCD5003180.1 o-succinylbenzoate--CoA ligase [Enterococcus saccharolyticus]
MWPNSWLQYQAKLQPERPAFYWKDKSWSFSALNQHVQAYAAYYQQKLPKSIQRVALFSENTDRMLFSILALWELGIEIQFLNTRLTTEELLFQLTDAQTIIVISEKQVGQVSTISFPLISDLQIISPTDYVDNGYRENQIASIMYTSGTTGQPKGVPQTFGNHRASAEATQENMQITSADCWLCPTALYHISGLSIVLRMLRLGMSLYLYEKFVPEQLVHDILSGQGTVASVVSKMLTDCLPLLEATASFRYFLLGGGPISEAILQQCEAKELRVIQSFGMTETCSQVIAMPPEKAQEKLGSTGIPLKEVSLKLERGEILLKGPSIVTNYLNHRGENAWDNEGWFHTGDLGKIDEDGYLYVLSRMSELIISGGENIYPAEVEKVLLQHPAIQEAVVVGQEDVTWGQVPVAYLKINQSLTLSEVTQSLQVLAKYKRPKAFFVVKTIPKTASGKPLKRKFLTEERVNFIEYQLNDIR